MRARKLNAEKPTVWVRKEGATPQIVNEISGQLDRREIVKAKIPRSALKDEEAKSVTCARAHIDRLARYLREEVDAMVPPT